MSHIGRRKSYLTCLYESKVAGNYMAQQIDGRLASFRVVSKDIDAKLKQWFRIVQGPRIRCQKVLKD